MPNKKANLRTNILGLAILTIATLTLIKSSVLGLGRTSEPYMDFNYFFVAGKILLRGQNPYDNKIFLSDLRAIGSAKQEWTVAFPYPFTIMPFCLAMASMRNLAVAKGVMLVLNLIALTLLAVFSIRLVTHAEQPHLASRLPLTSWLMPSLVIASPFTQWTIWLGQSTVLAAVFLVGGWYFVRRGRDLWAGILFGLATMKPQFIVLPCLWLLLDRHWKTILTMVMIAAALSSYMFWFEGPLSATRDWLVALSTYQAGSNNKLGSADIISLPSILVAAGIPNVSIKGALLIGALITLVLWKYQTRIRRDDVLGILVGTQLGLVYCHVADLLLLVPMTTSFWLHLADRRRTWPLASAFILIMFIIGKIIHKPGLSSLAFSIGIMLLVALGLLLYLSLTSQATLDQDEKPGLG